jgi:Outer membrane protein beta-barrel domain
MKKIVFIIIFVGFSIYSFGQFGFKLGVNFSGVISPESTGITQFESKNGLQFGVAHRFGLSESIDLQLGAIYSNKGFKITQRNLSESFSIAYFEFPLIFQFKFPLWEDNRFFLLNTGAYFGTTTNPRDGIGVPSSSADIGWIIGTGLQFDQFNIHLNLEKGTKEIGIGKNYNVSLGIQYFLKEENKK